MIVQVDVSGDDAPTHVGIAADGPGDTYDIELGALLLTVNYEQMKAIYDQLRPWFDDDD